MNKALFFLHTAILILLTLQAITLSNPKRHSLIKVMSFCLTNELIPQEIGRSYNSIDLLLGFLGGFMAYLSINDNKDCSA